MVKESTYLHSDVENVTFQFPRRLFLTFLKESHHFWTGLDMIFNML